MLGVGVNIWVPELRKPLGFSSYFPTNPPLRSWDLTIPSSFKVTAGDLEYWDECLYRKPLDRLTAADAAHRAVYLASDAALGGLPSAANPGPLGARYMRCDGDSAIPQRWTRLVMGREPSNANGYWFDGASTSYRCAIRNQSTFLTLFGGASGFQSTIPIDTTQGSIVLGSANGAATSSIERYRFDGTHDAKQLGTTGVTPAKGLSIFGLYTSASGYSISKISLVLDFAGDVDASDLANFLNALEVRYGLGPFDSGVDTVVNATNDDVIDRFGSLVYDG